MYEGWTIHRVVRPSRLANAVVERLLLRILDGEFPPGADLPPEAALAAEFAVSRTILREALKALEEKRVLRIRHGRGTTVRDKSDWNLLDPLVLTVQLEYGGASDLGNDLMQVRDAMMRLMAELAAVRATADQRRKLESGLQAMRDVTGDPTAHREASRRFAAELALAAGNEVARCVADTIDVPAPAPDSQAEARAEIDGRQRLAESVFEQVMAAGPRDSTAEGAVTQLPARRSSDESQTSVANSMR